MKKIFREILRVCLHFICFILCSIWMRLVSMCVYFFCFFISCCSLILSLPEGHWPCREGLQFCFTHSHMNHPFTHENIAQKRISVRHATFAFICMYTMYMHAIYIERSKLDINKELQTRLIRSIYIYSSSTLNWYYIPLCSALSLNSHLKFVYA